MLRPAVTQIARQRRSCTFLDDHHGALNSRGAISAWRKRIAGGRDGLARPDVSAHWRIAVENTANLPLASLRFPRIPGIAPQENERLAAPIWMGQLAEEPRRFLSRPEKPGRMEWDYPGGLSLQCIALYREDGPGLFISSDDPAAFAKRFCVFGGAENRAGLEVVHLPQSSAGQTANQRRVALGTFEGDWFGGRAIPRLGPPATLGQEARLKTGRKTGPSDRALYGTAPLRPGAPGPRASGRTGLPVSVFWHWWHDCPTSVPGVPPAPRTPNKFVTPFMLREAGIHAMVT